MATSQVFRPVLPIGNGLSRYERETIIRISDDENEWDVYTSSPAMARKFEKLAQAYGIDTGINQGGLTLKLPKNAVSFRKPMVLTEEQRRSRANRLKNSLNLGKIRN